MWFFVLEYRVIWFLCLNCKSFNFDISNFKILKYNNLIRLYIFFYLLPVFFFSGFSPLNIGSVWFWSLEELNVWSFIVIVMFRVWIFKDIVVESMYVLAVSLWQYTDFEQDISSGTRLDSRECSNNLWKVLGLFILLVFLFLANKCIRANFSF